MACKDVNRASLAEPRIRDLNGDRPSMPMQECSDGAQELGVVLIQQSIEVCSPPARRQLQAHLQCSAYPSDRPHRENLQMSSLGARD